MALPLIRPDLYRAPDVEQWKATHGFAPYPIAADADAVSEARLLVEDDRCLLDARKVELIQDALHMLGEAVLAVAGDLDHALCYFRPEDGRFWVYPLNPAAPIDKSP